MTDILDEMIDSFAGTSSPEIVPTPEQEAILDAATQTNDSLMIVAMAGCAKTTTLVMLAKQLPPRPSLALAFNVKIKKELEKRMPANFEVMTLNGLGHRAWGRAISKRCSIEDKKIGSILKQILKDEKLDQVDTDEFIGILQIIRRARSSGLIPAGMDRRGLIPDTEDGWQLIADSLYMDLTETTLYVARKVLRESIRQAFAGVIDFDDQIYMSALFGGVFPKYPVVLGDEWQDASPLNHIQVQKCAQDRLIMCGDPRQAIYAFRGADSSSMNNFRKVREKWIDLPLSTTFRCPKVIVARQQKHAPGFTAADEAPEGEILNAVAISNPDGQGANETAVTWKIADIIKAYPSGGIAILCRNNAPLLACGLRIIRSGFGCTILGREIGKSLITLAKKICPQPETDVLAFTSFLRAWAEQERALARANEKDERVAIITDKEECLLAVVENGNVKTVGELCTTLTNLFASENLRILLATGHKAKGLEWPTVIHLDPFRVPSKHARNALERGDPIPMEQDMNLRYVIETRTQRTLITANLEDME